MTLPFEGDSTLSIILSKAFLLADDQRDHRPGDPRGRSAEPGSSERRPAPTPPPAVLPAGGSPAGPAAASRPRTLAPRLGIGYRRA